jgi:hypothetical protein
MCATHVVDEHNENGLLEVSTTPEGPDRWEAFQLIVAEITTYDIGNSLELVTARRTPIG